MTALPSGAYEFLLTDTGILLNSEVSPTQPFVDVTEVVGVDNAPFRETFRDHEGTDGGFLDAEFEKGREIVITGTVYGPTTMLESYLDSLKANFAPRQDLVPLYFWTPGVGVRFLKVKPRGCRYNWEQGRRTGQVPIQFGAYAEDPRIYTYPGQEAIAQLLGQVDTGFGFNFGFNIDFGGMGSSLGFTNCYNEGNRPAPVVFDVYGPADQPLFINDVNDERLQSSQVLGPNDVLTFDTLNRTVTLNGINRRNTVVLDDWIFLQRGSNPIRFHAVGGGGDRPPLNVDPSFESGSIGGWTENGSGTLETSTEFALFGQRSLKWSPTVIPGLGTAARSEFVPVTEGQAYTGAGWVYSPQGYPAVNSAIDWFDGSAVQIGSAFGDGVPLEAGTWRRFTVTGVAPTGAVTAQVRMPRLAVIAAPVTFYIDMATLSLGNNAPAFAKIRWNSTWR